MILNELTVVRRPIGKASDSSIVILLVTEEMESEETVIWSYDIVQHC
jgi:hypothetical protein